MVPFPAEFRLPFAAVLLSAALIFCVTAYLRVVPSLALCTGICVVSAARIIYAVARERGFLIR